MRAILLAPLLLALAVGGLAPAGVPKGAAPASGPGDREAWVGAIREARENLARARHRYEAALDAYRTMRHRRKARGAKKATLVQERDQARAALEEAESELERLLESARRAGVPPGWVREALEPEPADRVD